VLYDSGVRVLTNDAKTRPAGAEYVVASDTHHWQEATFYWLAEQKQRILDLAREEEYDAVWLVDTDLLVEPGTLQSLIDAEKPIVSAVFWTAWQQGHAPLPQVWLQHPYGFAGWRIQEHEFFRRLSQRQLLRVLGLGACTLIRTETLEHVCYWPYLDGLPRFGMWQGEDRTFCVRANRAHIPLFADAWPDIFHVYRPEDREFIPNALDFLAEENPVAAEIGSLISAIIEPLEEPGLMNLKLHLRGRLGGLNILPEIEQDLLDLPVGEECITKLHFPSWYELEQYRGQTKLVRLRLLDVKPNLPHIGLPQVESSFSRRFYNPTQLAVIRRSRRYGRTSDETKH
jgi:hypothetical protein